MQQDAGSRSRTSRARHSPGSRSTTGTVTGGVTGTSATRRHAVEIGRRHSVSMGQAAAGLPEVRLAQPDSLRETVMPSSSVVRQSASIAASPRLAWAWVRLAQPARSFAVTGPRVATNRRASSARAPVRRRPPRAGPTCRRGRRRHPLVEGRVGLLLAAHRTADQHLVVFGVHHQVREPLAVRRDPGRFQGRGQFLAGAVPATGHLVGQDVLDRSISQRSRPSCRS